MRGNQRLAVEGTPSCERLAHGFTFSVLTEHAGLQLIVRHINLGSFGDNPDGRFIVVVFFLALFFCSCLIGSRKFPDYCISGLG